jgi:hypothetical protein
MLGIVELTGVGSDPYGVPMTAAAAPRPEPGSGEYAVCGFVPVTGSGWLGFGGRG